MKNIFTILLILSSTITQAQQPIIISDYFVVGQDNNIALNKAVTPICKTDSVRWITIDTVSIGKNNCVHNFVFSETYIRNGYYGCLVMHGEGCHCDMNDPHRKAICNICGFLVEQRLFTYQSTVKKQLSDYEKTINSFKKQ